MTLNESRVLSLMILKLAENSVAVHVNSNMEHKAAPDTQTKKVDRAASQSLSLISAFSVCLNISSRNGSICKSGSVASITPVTFRRARVRKTCRICQMGGPLNYDYYSIILFCQLQRSTTPLSVFFHIFLLKHTEPNNQQSSEICS
jgi:hypothetical protein